jgi:transposase-like protein
MKALSDGMRTATAAMAKQVQTETEHRQVAQIRRIAELLYRPADRRRRAVRRRRSVLF